MTYDPRTDGARCDLCVLNRNRGKGPPDRAVRLVDRGCATTLLVGSPSLADLEAGHPLSDGTGELAHQLLTGPARDAQHLPGPFDWQDINLASVLACAVPGGDLQRVHKLHAAANERRKRKNEDPLPHPLLLCYPRLSRVLEAPHILAAGNEALWATQGLGLPADEGFSRLRSTTKSLPSAFKRAGTLISRGVHKVVPLLAFSLVGYRGRWVPATSVYIDRAYRWFQGQIAWQEPAAVEFVDAQEKRNVEEEHAALRARLLQLASSDPSQEASCAAQLQVLDARVDNLVLRTDAAGVLPALREVARNIRFPAYDTETTHINPLVARLRMFQVANEHAYVAVQLASKQAEDGWRRYFAGADLSEVYTALFKFCCIDGHALSGHNAGSYDRLVMEENFRRAYVRDLTFRAYVDAYRAPPEVDEQYDFRSSARWRGLTQVERRAWLLTWSGAFTPTLVLDSLLVHHVVEPDQPHRLGYVAPRYIDVHDWKGDNTGGADKETNSEYRRYGGLDPLAGARMWEPLAADFRALGGDRTYGAPRVLEHEHAMQRVCVGLQRIGMEVWQSYEDRPDLVKRWLDKGYRWDKVTNRLYDDEGAWSPKCRQDLEAFYRVKAQEALVGMQQCLAETGLDPAKLPIPKGSWVPRDPVTDEPCATDNPLYYKYAAFNPLSAKHVGTVLFHHWDWSPPQNLWDVEQRGDPSAPDNLDKAIRANVYTASGERGTGDPVLRAHLAEAKRVEMPPAQEAFVKHLRRGRRANKLIGDKLKGARRLRPADYDRDGYPALYLKRGAKSWDKPLDIRQLRRQAKAGQPMPELQDYPITAVWADGRLRTGWNAAGTNIGRGSSSSPYNAQNITHALRCMFVPAAGHAYVGADYDQLHLRIGAWLWEIRSLVEDFLEGRDPHATFARIVFGPEFDAAPGHPCAENGYRWEGLAKLMRNIGKIIRYTGMYDGSPATIHSVLWKSEDKHGELTMLDWTLAQVRALHDQWMEREPEYRRAWAKVEARWKTQGFLLDAVLGRRLDFLDGAESAHNQIINADILMVEASLAWSAAIKIVDDIPFYCWSDSTGLVNQCHDSMVLEVPDEDRFVDRAKEVLEAHMNVTTLEILQQLPKDVARTLPQHYVPITATADKGYAFDQVA